MPKPNSDNALTRDLLRLRDPAPSAEEVTAEPEFETSVRVKGPGFDVSITAKGAPWIVRKVLQDLDSSIEQTW
jgi:hypothetical protein